MKRLSQHTVAICVSGVVALTACNPDPDKTRIVTRIEAPDGTRDALYAEDMSGGATVGRSEDVYVVLKGRFPRRADRVFSQERVCNLKVRWLNNHAIEIAYSARTARLRAASAAAPVVVSVKWLGPDRASGC